MLITAFMLSTNSLLIIQVEWTKQLVAQQRQKTEKIEKETEKMKAISDAEREKEVDLIEVEKEIQVGRGREKDHF